MFEITKIPRTTQNNIDIASFKEKTFLNKQVTTNCKRQR